MPRDAEQWLAQRGVVRRPLLEVPDDADHPPAVISNAAEVTAAPDVPAPPAVSAPPADAGAAEDVRAPADALAFVRRSTSSTPQTEQRLRDKLGRRGFDDADIDEAMRRARADGLVDDAAMARSLVDEARRKGHSLARIRRDLAARGFDRQLVEHLVAPYENEDAQAIAFDLARRKAAQLSGVSAETAYRRVVGHVVRRGHPEALARKVARDAVFADREQQHVAGH